MRLKERKGGKSLFILHLRELSEGKEERRRDFEKEGALCEKGHMSLRLGAS
jgi:hypothetical protein